MRTRLEFWTALALSCFASLAEARIWRVAPSGGDFQVIQDALDVAGPGDTILVEDRVSGWREALVFRRGGDAVAGPLVLAAAPGHRPALDGSGMAVEVLVTIRDVSYVEVRGFEMHNLSGVSDGSGIRVSGACSHVRLIENEIHSLRGDNAMGITVYGDSQSGSIRELTIAGNHIHDCEPAPSEALVLNGNVERFVVSDNLIEDVDNIGIDFIGGETWLHPSAVARNGVCRGNVVRRARSSYGGGFGAGIYVDGGKDLLIEGNHVEECDLGIEIGAENQGFDVTGVIVRGNFLLRNDKAGIVFGGYRRRAGRVHACLFESNTTVENDTLNQGFGEIWAQWTDDVEFRNNVFVADAAGVFLQAGNHATHLRFEENLWYTAAGQAAAQYSYGGRTYFGLSAFQQGAGLASRDVFADPLFRDPNQRDFTPSSNSPAVDSGALNAWSSGLDAGGFPRRLDGDFDGMARIDRGAFEFCPARLDVAGELRGGTQLLVDLTGTRGLEAVVLAGWPGDLDLESFGWLRVDPGRDFFAIPLGTLPAQLTIDIPRELPRGTQLALQGLVLRGMRGALTNDWR